MWKAYYKNDRISAEYTGDSSLVRANDFLIAGLLPIVLEKSGIGKYMCEHGLFYAIMRIDIQTPGYSDRVWVVVISVQCTDIILSIRLQLPLRWLIWPSIRS